MLGVVYILLSLKNKTFYIGSTTNLLRRLEEHNAGKSKYTSRLLPLKLVFYQEYDSLQGARKIEHWLKSLKDKGLIENIVKQGTIKRTCW